MYLCLTEAIATPILSTFYGGRVLIKTEIDFPFKHGPDRWWLLQ